MVLVWGSSSTGVLTGRVFPPSPLSLPSPSSPHLGRWRRRLWNFVCFATPLLALLFLLTRSSTLSREGFSYGSSLLLYEQIDVFVCVNSLKSFQDLIKFLGVCAFSCNLSSSICFSQIYRTCLFSTEPFFSFPTHLTLSLFSSFQFSSLDLIYFLHLAPEGWISFMFCTWGMIQHL